MKCLIEIGSLNTPEIPPQIHVKFFALFMEQLRQVWDFGVLGFWGFGVLGLAVYFSFFLFFFPFSPTEFNLIITKFFSDITFRYRYSYGI
jgi:hypothetical protein